MIATGRSTEMRVWAQERGGVTSDLPPAHVVQCLLDELLGPRRKQPRPVPQPEDFVDEEEAAGGANAAANITDISASQSAEEAPKADDALAVTDCPAATSDDQRAPTDTPAEPVSGANSPIFVCSACRAEPDWPPCARQGLWRAHDF